LRRLKTLITTTTTTTMMATTTNSTTTQTTSPTINESSVTKYTASHDSILANIKKMKVDEISHRILANAFKLM